MINHFAIPEPGELQHLVRSFWEIERDDTVRAETILPKGVIEIIFNFESAHILASIKQQEVSIPRCFIQGFQTCPVQLSIAGPQHFFGVVLYPASIKYLLRSTPSEFSDNVIDLTLIDPTFRSLWQMLAEQGTFNDRVRAFTGWINNRLPIIPGREEALNKLLTVKNSTDTSVSALAKELCYSPRQLSRKILEITGMNTEQLILYKKYLHAVDLIHHSQMSMTEVAYSCHFSDQSHFNRTFKSLTHLTPKEYKNRKSVIPGHLF